MKEWLLSPAILMLIGGIIFLAGLIWAISSFVSGSFDGSSVGVIILGIAVFAIGTPK